jgi:probable phosphoglycerate mutase
MALPAGTGGRTAGPREAPLPGPRQDRSSPAALPGVALPLRNRYSVMRHGQSRANAAGLIVSSVEADQAGDWGLTPLGREQAQAAARASGLGPGTLVRCSDFARARQTAAIAARCLGAAAPEPAPELRERFFGPYDQGPVAGYALVWERDEARAPHAPGVEPAAAVLARAARLVAALEERHAGREVLLVSHGDTLQILQAGFAGLDPALHRRLPHLDTAEVRALNPGR